MRRVLMALVGTIATVNSAQSSLRECVTLEVNAPLVQRQCFVDDESYSVYLSLGLHFANKSAQTICVPKYPTVVRLTVAKSAKDLESGNYEMDITPDPVGSALAQIASQSEVTEQSCTQVRKQDVLRLDETSPPLLIKFKSSGSKGLLESGDHVMTIEIGGIHAVAGPKTSVKREETFTVRSKVIRFSIPRRENPPSVCQ